MALVKKHHLSGIVGAVVCYKVGNQEVVRSRPEHIDRKTPRQLAQRMKMSLTMSFLHGIRGIVRLSFPATRPFVNGHVLARSSVLRTPFIGVYPRLHLNYPKIRLSSDDQSGVEAVEATYNGEDLSLRLQFEPGWQKKALSFYLIQQASEKEIQTKAYGPLLYDPKGQVQVRLTKRTYHSVKQHFWVMLFDPLGSHFYGSQYFCLSIHDRKPRTIVFEKG
ncbi:DUF6266 family protein [Prolixibacteraceae bacterium]|nr:DUF6266 family protein [Prolixibacteraceae bacterium]